MFMGAVTRRLWVACPDGCQYGFVFFMNVLRTQQASAQMFSGPARVSNTRLGGGICFKRMPAGDRHAMSPLL